MNFSQPSGVESKIEEQKSGVQVKTGQSVVLKAFRVDLCA